MTSADIVKAEARIDECGIRYAKEHGENATEAKGNELEAHIARVYLREYWLALGIDPTAVLALSDKDLETYLDKEPLVQEYLNLADTYENNTGGIGKYMDSDCVIDWSALACTAWYFANNKNALRTDGDYSSFNPSAIPCPARLAGETGPQLYDKKTSNTMTYVAVGIGTVAVVGIAALLLRGK